MLLGAGTVLVYPTLLAVIGDVAHPAWRGRAVGIYRVWRDSGYAVGAIAGGIVADLMGMHAAVWAAAVVSAASALAVAIRMYETHRDPSARARSVRRRGETPGIAARSVRPPSSAVPVMLPGAV